MMKKLSIPLIFFISVFTSRGIADTIPNGGFEYWWYSGWTEDPAFWMVNNTEILPATVLKDSDAYAGSIAMLMIYSGSLQPTATCGFPINSHPLNVGGYVKNQLNTGDSVTFIMRLFSANVVVDSGYFIFYGGINTSYAPFVVPVSQNYPAADSCEISITGGMSAAMTTITFDDLQFDFSIGIEDLEQEGFCVFPNPAADRLFINFKNADDIPDFVEAINMSGQHHNVDLMIDNSEPVDYIVELNTSELNPGAWIITLRNHKKIKSVLLIKQ